MQLMIGITLMLVGCVGIGGIVYILATRINVLEAERRTPCPYCRTEVPVQKA
jgi:hypothetical protein